MEQMEESDPSMSDLSNLTGLSQILKNDDSIAEKVRSLLEDGSPTKPVLLENVKSPEEPISEPDNNLQETTSASATVEEHFTEALEDIPLDLPNADKKKASSRNVTNDDMLSLSTATEYQELPDVSPGNSLKENKIPDQAALGSQINSAESLAKISGKVRYYLESDPNTPQLDENGEEIENLKKYIEGGGNPTDAKEETPLLLQDTEKQKSSASSENLQSDPNSDEIRISPIPMSKKAWQSSSESIHSEEDNLTERIRKTLEGSGSNFNASPPKSPPKIEKKPEFFSLPSSPKLSHADHSLGSNDSLANHVKSLLSMRPKSASPMSMLHKSDRKILLNLNHEINSNTTGNLSQEIRNFEGTDLWKFAEQFMPKQNGTTSNQTERMETLKLSLDRRTDISGREDLDKSGISLSSSVDSILRRIHETKLSPKKEFSPKKSPTRSQSRSSRLPIYSPKHRKTTKMSTSPGRYVTNKTSPNSKIPVLSPTYKNMATTIPMRTMSFKDDEHKENKNPFAELNLQPFSKIFSSENVRDSEYIHKPQNDLSFVTPLQPKVNTIDQLSTSSLLRYKCDFPTPVTASLLDPKPQHSTLSNKSDNFIKRPAVPKKHAITKTKSPVTTGIDFPRSSYLREKIGLKTAAALAKSPDDSMQPLQGRICEATPAKCDDYFRTPKASASPPNFKTPIENNIKPVTILPTYDQMVVQDALKIIEPQKSEATPLHYSISDKTQYSPVVTHSTPMQHHSVVETYTKVPTSSITMYEPHLKDTSSDTDMQRRAMTPSNVIAEQNITMRSFNNSRYNNESQNVSLKHDTKLEVNNSKPALPADKNEETLPQTQLPNNNTRPVSADRELLLPDAPALPYVRLRQDAPVASMQGASVSRNKISPLRSISTEKVQSILLKEQSENSQNVTNVKPPSYQSKSKPKNINTSDPNVVLNKDLESLLQFCADKAPVITEILRHIYEQSLQKKREAATAYNQPEPIEAGSEKMSLKKAEHKQSKATQTWGEELEIYETNEQREVACQVGSILVKEPTQKQHVTSQPKGVNRSISTNTENYQRTPMQRNLEPEKQGSRKNVAPQSYFVEMKPTKPIIQREEAVKVQPVAWFEPYKFEPPWFRKEEPTNYGYVNTNVQDAFLQHKRDFVLRSWERQEDIQIRAERRKVKEIEENIQEKLREMHAANTQVKTVVREPSFAKQKKPLLTEKRKSNKNLTFKEMFEKSRKAYLNLPEVKARREKQKRIEAYAENRLRAQVYKTKLQKNVLNNRRSQG